jgi:hypothetical protein
MWRWFNFDGHGNIRMAQVTFYASSFMKGAPYLTTMDNNSLCRVLDACLVSGFGTYTPAGWNILYRSEGKRVYQAPVGNRFPIYVNEYGYNAVTTGPMCGAYVSGWQTSTGLGTGTGQFPTAATLPNGYVWQKYSGTMAEPVPWWFFGSGSFFWLIIACSYNTNYSTQYWGNDSTTQWQVIPYFYGDYIPFHTNNSYNTVIGASGSPATLLTSAAYSWASTWSTNGGTFANTGAANVGATASYGACAAATMAGVAAPVMGLNGIGNATGRVTSVGGVGLADSQTNKGILYKPYISHLNGSYGSPMGKLPGMWMPLGASAFNVGLPGEYFVDNEYNPNTKFFYFSDQQYYSFFIEYNPNVAWS